jgi:hypothetical protein
LQVALVVVTAVVVQADYVQQSQQQAAEVL